jgi:ribosomal protein S18 acetylase RimI-like enzyme
MKQLRPSSHHAAQLREAGEDDDEKLFSLFAASRDDLLAAISNLDDAQRETLLRHQFQAQRHQYRYQFPHAQRDLIIVQGEVIGQMLVAPMDGDLHLVDLSLLPEFRNRGIGNALLQDLLARAAGENKRVTLHVLQGNPAVRLYARLGFSRAGEQDIYWRMEWAPASGVATGSK